MQAFIVALITWACTTIAPQTTTTAVEKIQIDEQQTTTYFIQENDSLSLRG